MNTSNPTGTYRRQSQKTGRDTVAMTSIDVSNVRDTTLKQSKLLPDRQGVTLKASLHSSMHDTVIE